jgi:GAF domain-containing protein
VNDSDNRALFLVNKLAQSLTGGDLDATLSALTRAAVETLPGVDHASITVRHDDGSLQSCALTAPFLESLDAAQYAQAEGPCYDGVVHNAFTVCGDLLHDPRYPNYGPRAAADGIRSQAGMRLFESNKTTGALNLYSTSVHALSDIAFLATLFSTHARTAITYAREIEGLNDAVTSRQLIGQAVGILMERFNLTDARAFAFLARVSQDRNIKLRLVAQEVIAATQEDDPPAP